MVPKAVKREQVQQNNQFGFLQGSFVSNAGKACGKQQTQSENTV